MIKTFKLNNFVKYVNMNILLEFELMFKVENIIQG